MPGKCFMSPQLCIEGYTGNSKNPQEIIIYFHYLFGGSLDWSGIHSLCSQRDPSTSASQILGLNACATAVMVAHAFNPNIWEAEAWIS